MSNTTFAEAGLASVSKGKKIKAIRCGVYGPPGIGKTTLVAKAKKALYLDFEKGSLNLDVTRLDEWTDWKEVENVVENELPKSNDYQTIIVDSLSSAERLLEKTILQENGWKNIAEPGFGVGYVELKNRWAKFMDFLSFLHGNKNMNIIIVGHSTVKEFPNPSGDNFIQYTMSGDQKRIVDPTIQWLDNILFCNKKQIIKDGKVKGERRVMYTSSKPGFEAKCREALPDELDLDWDAFTSAYLKAVKGGE